MASDPITSWQIDGEKVETVADFIFLGSKITADGNCSHEIKRHLLLGRKTITNLDSILKSRDITLLTKICIVKLSILQSLFDCKEIKPVTPKGNQPWIFIGRTDAEAEAPVLWHLMQGANSLEKTLMLGKIEVRRRRGWPSIRWLDSITYSLNMSLSKLQEIVKDRESWHAAFHGVTKSWTWLSDWITIKYLRNIIVVRPLCSSVLFP